MSEHTGCSVAITVDSGFDGDQLSGCIALSNEMAEFFQRYRPHYGIHSFREPGEFKGNMSLPEVDIGILASFVEEEDFMIEDGVL